MSVEHTPGPWLINKGTPSITKEWNGHTCIVAQVKTANLLWHENPNCASDEAFANARIIAAAPELLKALEGLLENYKKNNCQGLGIGPQLKAKAAIAKAKHKQ